MTAGYLEVSSLSKSFGQFRALTNVSLSVSEGSFVVFLGPSGCGKTTLLRILAGLETHDFGSIRQGGRDLSGVAAIHRDFGIVFQSYALFPNLNVLENVGYGLRSAGVPRHIVRDKVAALLQLMGMTGSEKKFPNQLSGGQQQRVALARALARSPGLLLLDEPLSALDARVRLRLRREIKDLQKRLGITTVMVTHDQDEALTMADQIVVMNEGRIEQIGTPSEIYGNPSCLFVANFVGTMNTVKGTVLGPRRLMTDGQLLELTEAHDFTVNSPVLICARPEEILVSTGSEHMVNSLLTAVSSIEFIGPFFRVHCVINGESSTPIVADLSATAFRAAEIKVGQPLTLTIPGDRIRLFPHTEAVSSS